MKIPLPKLRLSIESTITLVINVMIAPVENHTQPTSPLTSKQADNLPVGFTEQVDEIISHYPISKRSASLPLLHLWQNHFGYIDDSGIEWIAKKLELEPVNIFELVTFYPWFRREAAGRTIIRVCRTLSCALAGSYKIHDGFCKSVGIEPHHHHLGFGEAPPTSPDGKFSVEFVECLASCGSAPVALINNELHENLTVEKIPTIVEKLNF